MASDHPAHGGVEAAETRQPGHVISRLRCITLCSVRPVGGTSSGTGRESHVHSLVS